MGQFQSPFNRQQSQPNPGQIQPPPYNYPQRQMNQDQFQLPLNYRPQPPKLLPHQRLFSWYRARTRKAKIGLGCGTLILALLLCTCSVAAFGSGTSAPQTTATTPITLATRVNSTQGIMPTPTLIPTPTDTPAPTARTTANVGPAILGATPNAFIAKFGKPNDHSDPNSPHFERCPNGPQDQIILTQFSQPNIYVDGITYAPCSGTQWSSTLAYAQCAAFFPVDAQYKRTVTIPGTSTQFAAIDKIYYSTSLAHEFAATDFTDANGNPVQPGLFDVQYLYVSDTDTSHVDSCSIQLGTQQTHT